MILALLVAAFVFFLLGAFLYPSPQSGIVWYRRPDWISLGLACWVLTELIAKWPK
jgi:hypothetical protein